MTRGACDEAESDGSDGDGAGGNASGGDATDGDAATGDRTDGDAATGGRTDGDAATGDTTDGKVANDGATIETDLDLVAIVAVAENGVIGKNGDMPWHIPEDLAHFKRHTTGHPVIMGRVTYESILAGLGEPLPGRTSIVLTGRDLETPDRVVLARDLGDAVRTAETAAAETHDGVERAFVAGGATVYEQFLPAVDRLVVTEVHEEPAGDTYFPSLDRSDWQELSREGHDGFAFVEYRRVD